MLTMLTIEEAVEIADGWSSDSGSGAALYRFSSWDGRVFDEGHREACLMDIRHALLWMYAKRQDIVGYEEGDPNQLSDWADLVRLEQFILAAEVDPL